MALENRRPSPWQGPDEDVHGDANDVKQAESLPVLPTAREPVLLADAAECTPFTDARLTEPFVRETLDGTIPDDRLFTVTEVASLLKAPKSVVYAACDSGELQYIKFEGVVQVEGRELKAWLAACHRPPSSTP